VRWNKPGRLPRIPTGRGFAVTSASRISAGGTVAAVVICVAAGLLIGQSVLHGGNQTSRVGRPTRPALVTRTSARPSPTRPRAPSGAALARAVRHLMYAQHGIAASREYKTLMTPSPVVHFSRVKLDKSWVLGTTAIPVPAGTAAPPATALFLGHVRGTGWAVALSGTPAFAQMLKLGSGKVVTSAEARLLAQFSAVQAATGSGAVTAPGGATPLALPWGTGQSWRLGGVAGIRASAHAMASLVAFAGGDGRVRAAGEGRLYRFCGGRRDNALIEIIHADGSATQYGQLAGETTVVDGTLVARGAYLGMTGTTLACGGTVLRANAPATTGGKAGASPSPRASAAAGGAVAFAILKAGDAVTLNGVALGDWILHEQGAPPVVSAQRAKTHVVPGGLIKNFGLPAKPPAAKATARPSPSAGKSTAALPVLPVLPVADVKLPSLGVTARATAHH
jgi:hypothetical protein